MRFNLLTIALAVITSVTLTACAQSKKGTKSETSSVTHERKAPAKQEDNKPVLLQATTQKTLPGRPESKPTTERLFVVVWKDNAEPGGFFWKGTDSWLPCNINSIKNYKPLVVKDDGRPFSINYERDFEDKTYAAGDTLELYPGTGGKHPIPEEVPLDKNNIIYYKTANSKKWMPLPVDTVIKLPSIAMP